MTTGWLSAELETRHDEVYGWVVRRTLMLVVVQRAASIVGGSVTWRVSNVISHRRQVSSIHRLLIVVAIALNISCFFGRPSHLLAVR